MLLGCVSHQGSSIWSPGVSQELSVPSWPIAHSVYSLLVQIGAAFLLEPMKNLFEVLCMAQLICLETQSLHFLWGRPIASQLSI